MPLSLLKSVLYKIVIRFIGEKFVVEDFDGRCGRHVRVGSIVPRNGANVNRRERLSMAGGYVFRGVSR